MFTGIIQSLGEIKNIDSKKNTYLIKTTLDLNDSKIGSSICCDGVCLTVINLEKKDNCFEFEVNVGEETLKRTNLINWNNNYKINLEKSLKLGDEIGGHYVYGHIDTLIPIINIREKKNSWEFEFSLSQLNNQPKLSNMIVEKGSIAINGISLTVANIYENSFNVSIIPHTFHNTNFCLLREDHMVNIEFDPLARYLSKYNGK